MQTNITTTAETIILPQPLRHLQRQKYVCIMHIFLIVNKFSRKLLQIKKLQNFFFVSPSKNCRP